MEREGEGERERKLAQLQAEALVDVGRRALAVAGITGGRQQRHTGSRNKTASRQEYNNGRTRCCPCAAGYTLYMVG
jgi:hypothetical protein